MLSTSESHTIFVPYTFKKRGGRKLILVPEEKGMPSVLQSEPTLVKALVKAHLLTKQLQIGKYGTIQDLADGNKLCLRYTRYLLQLVFLAPQIQEAIMKGTQPRQLKLCDILGDIPLSWPEQLDKWGFETYQPHQTSSKL